MSSIKISEIIEKFHLFEFINKNSDKNLQGYVTKLEKWINLNSKNTYDITSFSYVRIAPEEKIVPLTLKEVFEKLNSKPWVKDKLFGQYVLVSRFNFEDNHCSIGDITYTPQNLLEDFLFLDDKIIGKILTE